MRCDAKEKCDICAVNKFSTFHADSTQKGKQRKKKKEKGTQGPKGTVAAAR